MTKEEMQEVISKVDIDPGVALEEIILDGVNRFMDNPDHAEQFYKAHNTLLKAFYLLSYATSTYPNFRALYSLQKRVEGKLSAREWQYLADNTENIVAKIEYSRRGKSVA